VLRDVQLRHGQHFGAADDAPLNGLALPAQERLSHSHLSSLR
jgi:hypothetical protein